MKNLTIGKRIILGFTVILLLAATLGGIAVYEMKTIAKMSSKLAKDYAPEVKVANEIDRSVRELRFEIRGYNFTEEQKFYDQAKTIHKRLNEQIKKAEELAKGSTTLKKLAATIDPLEKDVHAYDQLINITKEHVEELADLRKNMDDAAGHFVSATNRLYHSQEKQLSEDLKNSALSVSLKEQRIEKIGLIIDIMNIGSSIRVGNFKSQALRSPAIYETALKEFQKFPKIITRLKEITFKANDIKDINEIESTEKKYHQTMDIFLKEWKDLQSTSVSRKEVATKVLKRAEEVSLAGVENTVRIAKEAMEKTAMSNKIMTTGVIILIILGAVFSYLIVTLITVALRRLSASLKHSSSEVAIASAQLSAASQQLAGASNQQAASIEETSASLEEITGMVNTNVDNAEHSVDLSKKVSESANKGNMSMQQMITSMQNILKSNQKIQELVGVIGEIGEKTAIIDEIVFQTKLLSFNASVEAERAGEHGRGFAVVAQEVGNLAQMSGAAATEISTIVKESIQSAEAITNENKEKVEAGSELVTSTAQVLSEIAKQSKELLDSINLILKASKDQSVGIGQINIAVSELDKAVQQNAATAEETSSSSEELNGQAESLKGMVSDLNQMVDGSEKRAVTSKTTATKKVVKKADPKAVKKVSTPVDVKKIQERPVVDNKKVSIETVVTSAPVVPAVSTSDSSDDWESI